LIGTSGKERYVPAFEKEKIISPTVQTVLFCCVSCWILVGCMYDAGVLVLKENIVERF
jgi:hypothetical protein